MIDEQQFKANVIHELTAEILSRTKPSLIDLGIATAAGVAAAMATVRSNVSDSLPGVAIAVALLPPLSAAAICMSVGTWQLTFGALLLFCINLAAIILVAMIVFWLDGYGALSHSWPTFLVIIVICITFAIPLNRTMQQLKYDDLAQHVVEQYLRKRYKVEHIIHPHDLSQLATILKPDHIFIFVELKAPKNAISRKDLQHLHSLLAKELKLPVNLKVQFLLSDEYTIYKHLLSNGTEPDYGEDELVPRR